MPEAICAIIENGTPCGVPVECRAMCKKHYVRFQRHGDPIAKRNMWGEPERERFWAKVDKDGPIPAHAPFLGPCWLWGGSTTRGGYGTFARSSGRTTAHRVAFELEGLTVPKGMELDHLCKNRACVNPEHLEPVSHEENLRRADAPRSAQAAKTHCPHGHPYTPENTYVYRGKRSCRICSRAAIRRSNLKRKVQNG